MKFITRQTYALLHIATALLLFAPFLSPIHAQEDANLIINEVQVANLDQYLDNALCYGSWIELYNPTSSNIPLTKMYISDGTNERRLATKYGTVPAGGFLTLWFDHYQTEGNYGAASTKQIAFKLEYEGGTIAILDSAKNVISSVTYPMAVPRCSWARTKDGGAEWAGTGEPTPGASNATSKFASLRMSAPNVNTDSKVFKDAFTVRVKIPSGATLRYTTDGSAPTLSNGETSTNGRFDISATTILRLCLFRDGYLPSRVVTRSYIYQNHDYYLPILSVASAPENFFDTKIGVFVRGTNGIVGNGQNSACNWNMDWERPVNMEYLVPNEESGYTEVLNQEADLEICGGWTRAYGGAMVDGRYWEARSSFRLKTDKRYEGVKSIDYPVFPQKPYNKYRCWQVRNGGNDTYTRIKDPAVQTIVSRSGFYVDCQDYQPAHVFLNGMYYGMLNIREANNKHFAYSNYGIDFEDMDQFELSNATYNQKMGDNKAWSKLVTYAGALSRLRTEKYYNSVSELLDIDEYANYMALECYVGSSDWITNTNNVKGFRSRSDGKFHFVLFDIDAAFSSDNMLEDVLATGGGANVDDLFRYMIKYDPFCRRFIDAFCIVDGSIFEPTRCEEIIREIYDNTNTALNFEGSSSSLSMINTIRSAHNGSRITNLRNHFNTGFDLYATISANIPQARLALNGQEIPTGKFSGYLFSYKNLPIDISAKAPAGYTFQGWQSEDQTASTTTLIPFKSTWKYFDKGSMDNYDWKTLSFDEDGSGWRSAEAPFGYARGTGYFMQDSATTKLDYGTSSSSKRPTYYFRNTFQLNAPLNDSDILTFSYQIDDGMMLYVNGTEVGGYYVASGSPYSAYTTDGHFEGNEPYNGSIVIPHELLQVGTNQIAVEAKNTSASSTDMWFDGCLTLSAKNVQLLTTNETIDLHATFDANSRIILRAIFTPITDEQERWKVGASPIRINEVSAGNDIYISDYGKRSDWLELYNTTDQDISLEGLYLSDNPDKPQKFQFTREQNSPDLSDETDNPLIIPAHSTRIVWCDGADAQGSTVNSQWPKAGALHAPFKLKNADGGRVCIQATDGSWADQMEYLEQNKWQTYGRYPDGCNMSTLLGQPTIDKTNKIGMEDYNLITDDEWLGGEKTITIELAKGWNWTSHNMNERIDRSRFLLNALTLAGEESSLMFSKEDGWQGDLQYLDEAMGYKIQMQEATDVTLRGIIYDTTWPVDLHAGWNWIGCPLFKTTMLNVALSDFIPQEGDRIIGLDEFALYENGGWQGSLTALSPGQAYLLYTRGPQEFCWQSISPQNSSSRRYAPAMPANSVADHSESQALTNSPLEEDANPSTLSNINYQLSTFNIHAYPDVMTMAATVKTDGVLSIEGHYTVGAFSGEECRGIGVVDDGLIYMNIHGEAPDTIVFRLLDESGEVHEALESVIFQSTAQLGSISEPYILWFGSKEIIDEVPPSKASSSRIREVQYYNLAGQRTSPGSQATISIRKVIYEDGTTRITKIRPQ